MVELKQTSKIVKKPHCFKHYIEVTYPKDNVKNMLSKWEEAIEESKSFLNNYEETFEGSLKEGYARLEAERENAIKRKSDLVSLSREERAEKLLKEFDEFVEKLDISEETLSAKKKEYKAALETQMRPMKQKCKQTIKEKEEAIKAWKNPIIES